MSRQVNLDQPLSDEDRAYLVMMGRNDLIEANERNYNPETYTPVNDGHTGDVDRFGVDDARDLLQGENPGETPATVIQAVEVGKDPEVLTEPLVQANLPSLDEASEEEDEGDNYDDTKVWPKADLVKEAEERGLDGSGNRDEVIARLREDDASED